MRVFTGDAVKYHENGTATVTKRSVVSGAENTRIMTITQDQYSDWMAGMLIQDAFPHLTPDEREFLMTGIMPDEWANEIATQGEEES